MSRRDCWMIFLSIGSAYVVLSGLVFAALALFPFSRSSLIVGLVVNVLSGIAVFAVNDAFGLAPGLRKRLEQGVDILGFIPFVAFMAVISISFLYDGLR